MSSRYDDRSQHECWRCGATLSSGATFCSDCGERVDGRAADPSGYVGRYDDDGYERRYAVAPERRRRPWLPMALGLGGGALVGLAILLAVVLTRDDEPAVADVTATPSPIASPASVEPSVSTEPSAEATSTPEPTPSPRPALANASVVEVRTDGAELRTEPGGGEVLGTFSAGGRAFVIGAPQEAGGERWYRVAVVSGAYSGCEFDNCPSDIGYLSDGTSEADATLAPASPDCLSSPMEAPELARLLPLERLACYGGNPIVVRGTFTLCYCDGPIGARYQPAWLAMPITEFMFHGSFGLFLRFEDGVMEPEDLEPGDIVEATVAMEHEAAPDCTVRADGSDADSVPSRAEVVLACRTQLVAQEVRVVGFDDSVAP